MIWLASVASIFACVVASVVLAVGVVCLVVPLVVSVRAPDSGDLFRVGLRHPALSIDLRLPLDVVLHWIVGIPEPPPIAGHVAGVPLPPRALAPVANGIARAISGFRAPKPEAPEAPAARNARGRLDVWKTRAMLAAPRAAWETLPRFRRAIAIEVFAFDLDYGTGDPVTTGMIAGYLWQLAAVLPEPCYIRAEAYWLEPKIRFDGEARVLIFPWRTIVAGLCLAFAIARSAWKASRTPPPSQEAPKEIPSWPRIRTETETPEAAAPPSNPS